MNGCKHYGQSTCVYPGKRASVRVCDRCPQFVESGQTRAALRVVRKQLPVPREKWPASARFIARLARPEDKGVGSTIERLLGSAGRLFKSMVARLGKDCGCNRRRDTLNARYPYSGEP